MTAPRGWFARHPVLTSALALVILLGAVSTATEDDEPADRTSTGVSPDERPVRPSRTPRAKPHNGGTTGQQPDSEERPAQPPPRRRTYLVVRVVDGDTLELGNGQTVRLAGIDTPEVGECGYEAATRDLERLVLGRQVRLGASDEDRDQYGRLLRYVDIGPVDAGLRLIRDGLAIARYDSRDGYGYHPRENRYVAADRATKDVGCVRPVPLVQQPAKGGTGCAPGYSPCVPPYPPDADCPDVDGPVRVTGSDPHGLDADGDGVACE